MRLIFITMNWNLLPCHRNTCAINLNFCCCNKFVIFVFCIIFAWFFVVFHLFFSSLHKIQHFLQSDCVWECGARCTDFNRVCMVFFYLFFITKFPIKQVESCRFRLSDRTNSPTCCRHLFYWVEAKSLHWTDTGAKVLNILLLVQMNPPYLESIGQSAQQNAIWLVSNTAIQTTMLSTCWKLTNKQRQLMQNIRNY